MNVFPAEGQHRPQKPATWTTVVLTTAALYFARDIFIPIALALLLAFLLIPLVNRLRRAGLNDMVAVVAAFALGLAMILFVGGLVTFHLLDLASSLPEYRENIQAKIKSFTPSRGGIFTEARRVFETRPDEQIPTNTIGTRIRTKTLPTPLALPVEVRKPDPTLFELMQEVSGNLFGPVTKAGLVTVFVIFMLVQREDLRDRFLRVLGSSQMNVTTQALDEAAQRVSRYLFMQLIVNATFGIPIGIGLYFIGIPNAPVWGLLAILLRFIPYVGPIIASILPIGLALAVDPGWTKPVLTIGLFAVVELVSNNLVEPWLYATSTGISSFAIIVAAVFWTWLWGPVGLFLSTPLTVCLAVMGRYVPSLRFLHLILTDEPVLSEPARFYQRLLARNGEAALDLAEDALKKGSLELLYSEVIVPALSLAEHDRNEGTLDPQREKFILEKTREIVDEVATSEDQDDESPADQKRDNQVAALCIPANDAADEICAAMLMQLLKKKGVSAKVLSVRSLTTEYLEEIKSSSALVVCISALPPSTIQQARLFCKRFRAAFPQLKIVLGVWTHSPDLERIRARLAKTLIDHLVTDLREAVEIIRSITMQETPPVNDSISTSAVPANPPTLAAEAE